MSQPPPLPRAAVSRTVLWASLARFLMVVVGVGSVALVWWSLNRLSPLGRQVREKDLARAALAGEVHQLEVNWNADAARKLETQYQSARARLFAGPEAPLQWRAAFTGRGQELAFDTELHLGLPQPHPEPQLKLLVVPATLRLQPSPQGRGLTNSPYERLLNLAASLATNKHRVDLVELSVTSDSNSVSQTRAELRLWSAEKPAP